MLRMMPTLAVLIALSAASPALALECSLDAKPMVTHEEELELQQLPVLDSQAHMGASVRGQLAQHPHHVATPAGGSFFSWRVPVSLAAGGAVGAGVQFALNKSLFPWTGAVVGAAAGLGLHTALMGMDATRVNGIGVPVEVARH